MKPIDPPRSHGRRIYLEGSTEGVRVPVRAIDLQAPHEPVRLYDTSGPYGDPEHRVDVDAGLPPLRRPWIEGRGDIKRNDANGTIRAATGRRVTQRYYARRGEITEE